MVVYNRNVPNIGILPTKKLTAPVNLTNMLGGYPIDDLENARFAFSKHADGSDALILCDPSQDTALDMFVN